MAISDKAQRALEVGLVSKSLAQELSDAAATPAALSEDLKRNLAIGMASNKFRDEVVAAVEAGSTALSEDAKYHLEVMMASTADAQELIDEIEA